MVTSSAAAITPDSTSSVSATLAYTIKGLPLGRAIQNFYIGETYIYITQRVDNTTYLSRLRISGKEAIYMDRMTLTGWGHGEGLDFYRYNGQEYFLIPTKGNTDYPDYYWGTQVARLQYEPGKTYSSYSGVKRFTTLKNATSDGSSLGTAYRVSACVNGEYTLFRTQTTDGVIAYSYYYTTKLNQLLDQSSTSMASGSSTEYCLSLKDATSAFRYLNKQSGDSRIRPNTSFQGVELSSRDSIYLTGGGEGETPQIAMMNYKGAYKKLIKVTNVGTHEIEGGQTDRGRFYFLIVPNTDGTAKKDTQVIYYIDESKFGINHTISNIAGTAPTCTTAGLSDGATCSTCSQPQDVQEALPAKGHTSVAIEAQEPTCIA